MLPKTQSAVINRLEKRCCDCGQTKPLDAFHVNNAMPDGRQYRCKACRAIYDKRRNLEPLGAGPLEPDSVSIALANWKPPAMSVALVQVLPRKREASGAG